MKLTSRMKSPHDPQNKDTNHHFICENFIKLFVFKANLRKFWLQKEVSDRWEGCVGARRWADKQLHYSSAASL